MRSVQAGSCRQRSRNAAKPANGARAGVCRFSALRGARTCSTTLYVNLPARACASRTGGKERLQAEVCWYSRRQQFIPVRCNKGCSHARKRDGDEMLMLNNKEAVMLGSNGMRMA